jgi:hypothetical protein
MQIGWSASRSKLDQEPIWAPSAKWVLVLQLQLAGITRDAAGSPPVMTFLGLMLMTASPQRPADHSSCMGGSRAAAPSGVALRAQSAE